MGLKLGQNITFRPFLSFYRVIGRDTGRDTGLSRHQIWTATGFSSLTCRGHDFFVLTRIWACEYSLERSLNVECSHEGI